MMHAWVPQGGGVLFSEAKFTLRLTCNRLILFAPLVPRVDKARTMWKNTKLNWQTETVNTKFTRKMEFSRFVNYQEEKVCLNMRDFLNLSDVLNTSGDQDWISPYNINIISSRQGNNYLIHFQILWTNIVRMIWQTVRKTNNDIFGQKGLRMNRESNLHE